MLLAEHLTSTMEQQDTNTTLTDLQVGAQELGRCLLPGQRAAGKGGSQPRAPVGRYMLCSTANTATHVKQRASKGDSLEVADCR